MTNMERACIGCKVRGRYLQPGGYTYTACNSQGKRISLGAPLEAVLSIEEDTPADAFTGVFPWKSIYEELEPVFLEICGGVIRQAYQKFGMELKEVQKEWIIIYAQKKGLEYSAIKIFN